MSIKTELKKTADYLRRTRKAILGRGGEIAETAGLKDLPDAIINIPADTSLAFQTDDTTAYEKVVPSGAEEYALLNRVGGMSYKTRNLIPFPYVDSTKTVNGITFTVNDDQTITANGTATSDAKFQIVDADYTDNTIIGSARFTCCPSGGSKETYCVYAQATGHYDIGQDGGIGAQQYPVRYMRYQIIIVAGYTANNLIFKPMLNLYEGSTAIVLPYEPYFEGLRHTKVTAIESEGANLIPFPYVASPSYEINGITWQINEDGGITVRGTATASTSIQLIRQLPQSIKDGESYCISDNSSLVSTYFTYKDENGVSQYANSSFVWKSAYTLVSCYIQIGANKSIDETIYPMLNRGTTAAPYRPYHTNLVDTYTIPEAIKSIEGYGLGVEGYPSEVDFSQKKYTNRCVERIFDGTENWTTSATFYQLKLTDAPILHSAGVCSHYSFASISSSNTVVGWYIEVPLSNVRFRPNLEQCPTVNDWKAYLAEQYANGTPVTFVYAIATTTETDITEYLTKDNFIKVEGGGVIRAVNEHKQGAPSTIKYTVKVGS